MCGRFTLTTDRETIEDLIPGITMQGPLTPRYNIAPSQPVATVMNEAKPRLTWTQWGLIPSWAKDPAIGSRMINARAETVEEKPSYRGPFKRKRCLVLADGFYEWRKVPGVKVKTPVYFYLKSGKPFAFAGLWDVWTDREGGELPTSTIITTSANELVAPVHERMPVILPAGTYERWLDPGECEARSLKPLLRPYEAGAMMSHAVSHVVNSPKNDSPACVEPVDSSHRDRMGPG